MTPRNGLINGSLRLWYRNHFTSFITGDGVHRVENHLHHQLGSDYCTLKIHLLTEDGGTRNQKEINSMVHSNESPIYIGLGLFLTLADMLLYELFHFQK